MKFETLHVIASEAKQSIAPNKGRVDCFASLAMTKNKQRRAKKPYAVRATGLRPCARLGRIASGPCRCANSSGLMSAAGFGGLNR